MKQVLVILLLVLSLNSFGNNKSKGNLKKIERVLYETISRYQATYISNPMDEEMLACYIERMVLYYKQKGTELDDWDDVIKLLRSKKLRLLAGTDLCVVFYNQRLVFGSFENPCEPSGTATTLRDRIWWPVFFDANGCNLILQEESDIAIDYRKMIMEYNKYINLSQINENKMRAFEFNRDNGLKVLCDKCICDIFSKDIETLKRMVAIFFQEHNEVNSMYFWVAFN